MSREDVRDRPSRDGFGKVSAGVYPGAGCHNAVHGDPPSLRLRRVDRSARGKNDYSLLRLSFILHSSPFRMNLSTASATPSWSLGATTWATRARTSGGALPTATPTPA